MATGIYGSVKLANVTFDDVDILFAFAKDRETIGDVQMQPLYNSITNNEFRKLIGADGVYKLRLPATTFNKLGFYTILVKPKSFQTEIINCSFVVTNDANGLQISKKGIVIPKLNFQTTGALTGYQIEYFDNNGVKVKNFHRIITSTELVSVSTNNSNSQASSTTYVIDPNGNNLFLTLTPDEISLISNASAPNLGNSGQKILISNTFFDPRMIEVEMVDQTVKTLSYGLFGNSTIDLEQGILSQFDDNNNLYKQYNLLTRKKQFSNGNVDIKEERTGINLNQDFLGLSQGQ